MNIEAQGYGFLRDRGAEPAGATERVLEALRNAIISLELKPGEPIDKAAICLRFGVSRFPVSEALSRLKAEGLVEIQPQRGSAVAAIRIADVRENMFLRKALETEVVRTLAGAPDAGTLAALRRNLRYQKSAAASNDTSGFHVLDLEFHDILLEAVGFPRVKAVAESARLRLDRVRRLLTSNRRLTITFKEHERIAKAVQVGSPEKAVEAMAAHLDSVMDQLQTLARQRPGQFVDANAPAAHGTSKRRRSAVAAE
jgi:DNA-binding GntR family transcriptional regulator